MRADSDMTCVTYAYKGLELAVRYRRTSRRSGMNQITATQA